MFQAVQHLLRDPELVGLPGLQALVRHVGRDVHTQSIGLLWVRTVPGVAVPDDQGTGRGLYGHDVLHALSGLRLPERGRETSASSVQNHDADHGKDENPPGCQHQDADQTSVSLFYAQGAHRFNSEFPISNPDGPVPTSRWRLTH